MRPSFLSSSTSAILRVALLLATTALVSAKQYPKDFVVLTSIDPEKQFFSRTPKEGERVTISRTKGTSWDKTSLFVNEIVTNKDGSFEGTRISTDDAVKYCGGKPALFCVHGFLTEPKDFLEASLDAQKQNDDRNYKSKIIPVVWPSMPWNPNPLDWYKDVKYVGSEGAANAFKQLGELSSKFQNKSIMTHSMGNRVLMLAADPKFKFQNIFMVGADVDKDLFDEGNKDGEQILDMLSSSGKLCVVKNAKDLLLLASSVGGLLTFNTQVRLGLTGANTSSMSTQNKLKIENEDAGQWESVTSARKCLPSRQSALDSHLYLYNDEALAFYDKQI